MDDSLSQDEGVRARIDSVGQNTFFSTTTEESSTDSLDAAGSETERALEEIRRQYHESQKAERKESEELFFPRRRSDMKASFGDFIDPSAIGVFQEEDSEENAENSEHKRAGHHRSGAADLTGPNRIRISSDGDDEGTGGSLLIPDETNRSNNYFISPVSSRQTTVEKSPTLPGSHEEDIPHNGNNSNNNNINNGNNNDDNNNINNNNNNNEDDQKNKSLEEDSTVATNNRANLKDSSDRKDSGNEEVKIIVSSFTSGTSWRSNTKSPTPEPGVQKTNGSASSNKLTVERGQQASSDSGSSSSGGTAVGMPVSTDPDTDGPTPRNFLSEESDGITDRDSISRTHSPCGFPHTGADKSRSGSQRPALTTSCCQTSEADFAMVTQAEMGEAVNATVRRSSPSGSFGFDSRGRSLGKAKVGAIYLSPKDGEDTPTGQEMSVTGAGGEAGSESGENSKYRLSALPTNINPLELMRRLRHSQDELLRTGSVQSDSSGFGDADPTPDSGHSEGDQPKVSSLGSSHDSGDTTLAGSSGSHQHRLHLQQTATSTSALYQHTTRGEMATQTPGTAHSPKSSLVHNEGRDGAKESPLPGKEHSSFITTCFIPSLSPREGQASDGLRHRRGSQHPQAPSRSLQQQQQQQLYGHHHQQQLQHYGEPVSSRHSNTSHAADIPFHDPSGLLDQSARPYLVHQGLYHPHDPRDPIPPRTNSPHNPYHSFHEAHNPYGNSDYDDSDPGFYPRRFPRARNYRSAMSDSEWSGYPDPDYFGYSYHYDYNHTPPQHPRFFQRHRSADYSDYPQDGYGEVQDLNLHRQTSPSRRYRSQLELFTTGTGRLESGPAAGLPRSRSEDAVLDTESVDAGSARNQMPLSEELAAAIGGNATPKKSEIEFELIPSKDVSVTSSAQGTPTKPTTTSTLSSFTTTATEDGESGGRGNNSKLRQNLVASIFIPPSPSLTLTPATPEVSSFSQTVGRSAAPPESGRRLSGSSESRPDGTSITDQNLPALAGNLRSLPQGQHSTPVDQANHRTTVTIATSSSSGSSGPVLTPVTFTVAASGTGTPKTFSSSTSVSAPAFKSRQQRSCDILDDEDDVEFSNDIQRSSSTRSRGGPSAPSASFVSHVYYESKGGGGGRGAGMPGKSGPVLNIAVTSPFTSTRPPSQYSDSIPGSPSVRHKAPGPLPSPSRRYLSYHGYPVSPHQRRSYSSSSSSLPPMPFSAPHHPLSFSRGSDDMDGYFSSSVAESSSDLSFRSTPEWGGRAGILNSRKLARLINQPIYFKGNRRPGCNYRPRRLFKEWAMLSKRKRLQEENRLLQHTLHKYKTELGLMESTLKLDFQAAIPDMTKEERDQMAHVEWLWSEVKGEVAEMERLLLSRIKSVQAGNDFHTLLANMGIINKITELIKEQIYQQQVISSRGTEADDEDDNDSLNNGEEIEDTPDDLEMLEEEFAVEHSSNHSDGVWEGRNRSFHGFPQHLRSSISWMAGVGPASTPRLRSQGNSSSGSKGQPRSASSSSNLPEDLNVSLEQMKSSLLSQVQREIKDSTRKLELDLKAKDKEIQELKNQIGSRSARSTPDLTHRSVFKFHTKDWSSRPSTPQGQSSEPLRKRSRSRSRMMGDRIVQETDV